MGIQLSASVENIVGKEEIDCHKQFLHFSQCFQKQSVVGMLKQVSMTTVNCSNNAHHDEFKV